MESNRPESAPGETAPDAASRGCTMSVALCTCNGERFLGEQLQSLLRQTRLPSELVVCDDRSDDGTMDILRRFSEQSPFPVRIIRNEARLGSTRNFEKAIRLCQGEIIALCDQDDVWYPRKLEKLCTSFGSGVDLVFSDADVVDASLRNMGYRLWETVLFGRRERRRMRNGKALDVLLRRNVVTGATMAFRSQIRELVLPIPQSWVHDGWIALHTAAVGRVGFVDEPLIAYRQHDANQIGARREPHAGRLLRMLEARVDQLWVAFEQYTGALNFQRDRLQERIQARGIGNLEKKVIHIGARLAAHQDSGDTSLFRLIIELMSGRYHRYGRGALSFLKDVIILGRRRWVWIIRSGGRL